MPLPRTLQTLDVSEDRNELREDVLSVPSEDQPPMPVLQVDRESAVPRPDQLEASNPTRGTTLDETYGKSDFEEFMKFKEWQQKNQTK